MKILILANNHIGLFNFRYELIVNFLELGHDVSISLPYGDKVEELISIGCEFYDTPIDRHGMNPINELKLISKYKKLITEIQPDVILGYTIKPNIYGAIAARKLNKPFIANITGLGTAVEYKSWKQLIFINLYRYAFKDITKVFFQNESNRDFFLKNRIIKKNYEVLPGSGVNINKFKPYAYPEDKIIKFSFISRIMKEKGIEDFIAAAKYIKNKYYNTEFNVYGFCEQEYKKQLESLQKDEILNYHGLVNNIPEILKETHCLIHPTYYPEGMSNVLLEASATARPVITTNRPGCREIVDENKTGFIVNEADPEDLIRKIEEFLSLDFHLREQMGINGRKKIEKEFNREIVIIKYLKVISALE